MSLGTNFGLWKIKMIGVVGITRFCGDGDGVVQIASDWCLISATERRIIKKNNKSISKTFV